MKSEWFPKKDCSRLEIKKFKSMADHNVVKTLILDDAAFLAAFLQRIESMPSEGKNMIKMGGESEMIDLIFTCSAESRRIRVLNKMFQTPSTGFNSSSETEDRLYADIDALLFPALGKAIPKVRGCTFGFKDFSLTFAGGSAQDGAPATVSGAKDLFLLKPESGPEQKIEVVYGQVTPAPHPLKVGKASYKLNLYISKNGDRLFPGYFQVTQ